MFNWLKKDDKTRPDFSTVNSQDKALKLSTKDELSKLYLFPLEFGGVDDIRNIVFVPHFVVDLKARFDLMVRELLEKGLVNNYSASPVYKGESFIPSAIEMKASGDRTIQETINIW